LFGKINHRGHPLEELYAPLRPPTLNNKPILRRLWNVYGLGGVFGQTRIKTNYLNGSSGNFAAISQDAGVTPGYGSWDRTFPLPSVEPFRPGIGNDQAVNYAGRWQAAAPYIQNWTIGIERELPGSILVTASYVGNKGIRCLDRKFEQVDPASLLGNTLLADINSPEAQLRGSVCRPPASLEVLPKPSSISPIPITVIQRRAQTVMTRFDSPAPLSPGLGSRSVASPRQLSNTDPAGTFNSRCQYLTAGRGLTAQRHPHARHWALRVAPDRNAFTNRQSCRT
jgi:hypothetical protein